MNVSSHSLRVIRSMTFSILLPMVAITAAAVSPVARAADAGSAGTVDCMLPGEIRSVGGRPSMGARREVQTTTDDCKQRGGEYTVDNSLPATPAPAPSVASTDNTMIRCQLPRQARQLGSKAQYSTRSRTIHTTASNCQAKKGKVLPASSSKSSH